MVVFRDLFFGVCICVCGMIDLNIFLEIFAHDNTTKRFFCFAEPLILKKISVKDNTPPGRLGSQIFFTPILFPTLFHSNHVLSSMIWHPHAF